MEQNLPGEAPSAQRQGTLEVHYDDARAAQLQRARGRRALIGVLGFLAVGIVWLLLTAQRPDSGFAIVFTGLGYFITAAFLLLAVVHALRGEQVRARPFLERPLPDGPLLIIDETGIRLDEGIGVLVPYPWDMVVLEHGLLEEPRETTVTLHVGGARRLLAASALSCGTAELLRTAAELRARSLTR